jgi:hypothetical protein
LPVRVREIVAKSNRQSVGNVLIKEAEQIWAMDVSRLWHSGRNGPCRILVTRR